MIAGILPGIVYCVDCGQENNDQGEFCVRCMHPLLKRDIIHKLAVQQALLRNNDRVTVGTACQFVFRQPSPISATARIELVSGHRLPWAVDAILLMADTLVLGRGSQVHVPIPDLKEPVVLFRHKEALGVRYPGPLLINGQKGQGRTLLGRTATVAGEEFSFAIEPAGR